MKPNRGTQSGQSLVELAISLIMMLLLLVGAVEFSLALFQYVTIRDAAQEGAIYGSIKPTDLDGVKYRAVAAASDVIPNLTIGDVAVQIIGDDCEGLTGSTPNAIKVTITFAHPITMPLIGPAIGTDTINLNANVTNTILQPTCP